MLVDVIKILSVPLCAVDSSQRILAINAAASCLLSGDAHLAASNANLGSIQIRWLPGTPEVTQEGPTSRSDALSQTSLRYEGCKRAEIKAASGYLTTVRIEIYNTDQGAFCDADCGKVAAIWILHAEVGSVNRKSSEDETSASHQVNPVDSFAIADSHAAEYQNSDQQPLPPHWIIPPEPMRFDHEHEALNIDETSSEHIQLLLNSVECGLWERDLQTGTAWISGTLERQIGLSPGEFTGDPAQLLKFIHPSSYDNIAKARLDSLVNGGRYETDVQWVRKDGSVRWSQLRGTLKFDADGRPQKVVGLHIDITDKKLAEQSTQRLGLWIQTLSESIPVAFYSFTLNDDNTFAFQFCSESMEDVVGISASALVNDPALLLAAVDDTDVPECIDSIYESSINLSEWRQQFRIRHPTKGVVWIEGRSQPHREGENGTTWAGLLTDISETKRLEQDAENQRRNLQSILDTVPAPIFVKDKQGRYLRANPELCRILGMSLESILGKTDVELGIEDHPAFHADVNLFSPTVTNQRSAMAPLHTASGIRWLQSDKLPYLDDRGNTSGVIGLAVDITDRVQSEQALQLSEARLLEAQIIGRTGSFFWDAIQDCSQWSENLYRLMGIARRHAPGTLAGHLKLVHPEDRAEVTRQLKGAFRNSDLVEYEFRTMPRKGIYRWLIARGRISRDQDRRILSIAGICHDITDLKHAEEALRTSEQLHRNLLNAIPDAVLIHSKGIIRFCNEATALLFGADNSKELLGLSISYFLKCSSYSLDADVARDRARWLLRGDATSAETEFELCRKDGTSIPVETVSTPLTFEGVPSVLVAMHDLSKRRRMEEDLRQAKKMEAVGRLAGGIAHDFNNLLTVILGYSELLLSQLPATDPATRLIAEINKAGNRAAGLTRQLLTFSRRQCVEPIVVDMNWVILNSLQMLDRVAGDRISISTDLYSHSLYVMIDPLQLEQVLLNIVANARDAMPDGGQIVITTTAAFVATDSSDLGSSATSGGATSKANPLEAALTVSDTGKGIPQGIIDRVFDPFFTTKAPGHGIGLGLAVVHGIIEEACGRIEIKSSPENSTSLTIFLPALPAPATVEGAAAMPSMGGSESILIIDGDEKLREIAAMSLNMCGYRVRSARSFTNALQILEDHELQFDLIAADLDLPNTAATLVVELVTETRPATKLLFMSEYPVDALAQHGINWTNAEFIQKPFTPDVLCGTVRSVLDDSNRVGRTG